MRRRAVNRLQQRDVSRPFSEMKRYWVYILANRTKVLYVGVTDELKTRVGKHKTRFYAGAFTKRYNVDMLVYYETFPTAQLAHDRELQLKGLSRAKKIRLIEARNPEWKDLYDEVQSWIPTSG